MPGPKLYMVVGCPGSGKSHLIRGLVESGHLDRHLDDYLEVVDSWTKRLPEIRRLLREGKRIGICGQSFREEARRKKLRLALHDVPDSMWKWIYFEFDARSCMVNIIKDCLNDKGIPKPRAQCVLGVLRNRTYEVPPDAERRSIIRQEISESEIDGFLQRIKFEGATEMEIRRLLGRR